MIIKGLWICLSLFIRDLGGGGGGGGLGKTVVYSINYDLHLALLPSF